MSEIYRAYVKNVKTLKSKRRALKKQFNIAAETKNREMLLILPHLIAMLYSTFAEMNFYKTIDTPYGFTTDEKNQIKSGRNLEEKWLKTIELVFLRISNEKNLGEIQNKKKILKDLIDSYIIEPSQIRNKIAHGQWTVALNSNHSNINADLTTKLRELEFVKIDILFELYLMISQMVEDLIESPNKAHYNDFYRYHTEINEYLDKVKNWSDETRIENIYKQKIDNPKYTKGK